ncbi:MAG: hypothetical protein ACE5H7_08380 [Acidiferrobacterales bacterium]
MVRPFTTAVVVLLMVIGFVQFLRLLLGWEVLVGGVVIPIWASGVALAIALILIGGLWWENRK